jgi:hypothetical protein
MKKNTKKCQSAQKNHISIIYICVIMKKKHKKMSICTKKSLKTELIGVKNEKNTLRIHKFAVKM